MANLPIFKRVTEDARRYQQARLAFTVVFVVGAAVVLIWLSVGEQNLVASVKGLLTTYHNQTTKTLNDENASLNGQLTQARQDLGLEQQQVAGLQNEVKVLETQLTSLGAKPQIIDVPMPTIVTKPLPTPITTPPPTPTPTTSPQAPPTTRPSSPNPPTTVAPCMVPLPSLPPIPMLPVTVPPCLAADTVPFGKQAQKLMHHPTNTTYKETA